MKLVYKNILINAIISLMILFVGEYSLFYFLKQNMEKEVTEHLQIERHFMMRHLKHGVNIDYFNYNIGDRLSIEPIQTLQYKEPIMKDVEVKEEWEEEHFTSKEIVFDVEQNNKFYRVSISKTIDEDEGLAGSMSAIIFISGLCMFTILVLINVFVYHKLFSPVYKLIKDIKGFSTQQFQKIIPPTTSTQEFKTLGEEVSKMSEKMIADYASIKEFMENMTHEIQTPLAVINSKIERSFQAKDLSEEQAILLSDASKAVTKLFNINKGLTLLCRLDNKQYNTPVEISVKELIQQRLIYFSDFSENKKLTITETYANDLKLFMDASLSEILIDNLIKNAIQHNIQNGHISISIKNNQLTVANTGEEPKVPTTNYFDRFYSQKPYQSLGLGLSIIKKIVDYYAYSISYNYENEHHQVTIDFSEKSK
ncbi:MAG: HAMP domain-containing histidine kinase [Bacteroidetes bacterium]|nr:HAMP domain-containing histidine kinase [Bacteroidota bacterium]